MGLVLHPNNIFCLGSQWKSAKHFFFHADEVWDTNQPKTNCLAKYTQRNKLSKIKTSLIYFKRGIGFTKQEWSLCWTLYTQCYIIEHLVYQSWHKIHLGTSDNNLKKNHPLKFNLHFALLGMFLGKDSKKMLVAVAHTVVQNI